MSDFEAHTDQADAISSRAARDGRCTANDLQLVIAALVDQITVSDRRQADLLEGMHARLSELGSAARETRTRVPAAYADAFHRVEDALAVLASRIAEVNATGGLGGHAEAAQPRAAEAPRASAASRQTAWEPTNAAVREMAEAPTDKASTAPLALRSALIEAEVTQAAAATAQAAAAKRDAAKSFDPFDFADDSNVRDATAGWSAADAEALSQVYEDAGLVAAPPKAVAAEAPAKRAEPPVAGARPFMTQPPAPLMPPLVQPVEASPAAMMAAFAAPAVAKGDRFDKDWLEGRFAAIASKIEESFADADPEVALRRLETRFSDMEQRFGKALEDVATRADLDGLRVVEACLNDLVEQVDRTQQDLARVGGLEQQVVALAGQLSDDRLTGLIAPLVATEFPVQPAPEVDAIQIADLVAARLTELQEATPKTPARDPAIEGTLGELRTLLSDVSREQRSGDEQTVSMLDTMQQAIVRMLDRMDAIEETQQVTRQLAQHGHDAQEALKGLQGTLDRKVSELAEFARQSSAIERISPQVAAAMAQAREAAPVEAEMPRAGRYSDAAQPEAAHADRDHGQGQTSRSAVAHQSPVAGRSPDQRTFTATDAAAGIEAHLAAGWPAAALERSGRTTSADAGPSPHAAIESEAPAPAPLPRDRAQFIEAARRAAQAASERYAAGASAPMAASPSAGRTAMGATAAPSSMQVDPASRAAGRGEAGRGAPPSPNSPAALRASLQTARPSIAVDDGLPSPLPPQARPTKSTGSSSRTRLLMAALALMVLSFGGVKYLMSPSGGTPTQEIAERQRVTPQTLAREKAEAANASASTRARVTPDYPDAAAPGASPPDAGDTPAGGASKIAADGTGEAPFATASESGGAEQASATAAADGRFPLGIEIDRSAGDLTPGVINRTRMREQHARWSTQVGATQPNVMSFPNSLVPRAEPSADVNHVRADAAPQSASMAATTGQRITADALPAGERTAPRTTALPPATVGPQSLRMAAANGDPSAEFAVGSRFADGTAGKQDFNQAAIWYQRSAARGYALAQYRLATLYERGLGVKQDGDRAKGWYLKAAEQGNVKAMHNLAVLTAGQAQPDYTTAATWFTEAAERGLADSQFNLAILRDSGLGVSADKVEAYKWLALAAKAGDKEAGKRLSALGPQLSAPQRQSADAAVARWRPKPVEPMANDPVAASEAWKRGATG